MLDEAEKRRRARLLGKRIAHALKAEGITNMRLAEVCGVTPQAVTQWLAEGKIDKFYLPILARELQRDLAWFFVDERDPATIQGVAEEQPPYTHRKMAAALQRLRQMVESGALTDDDVVALVDFATRFKRAS